MLPPMYTESRGQSVNNGELPLLPIDNSFSRFSIMKSFRAVQPWKAQSPIVFTDLGRVMVGSAEQPLKAYLSILCTF